MNKQPETLFAERILLVSGVCCVFLAMVLGVLFAFVVSHVATAGIKESWIAVMTAVSEADAEAVRQHFAVIADMTAYRGRIMNSHSHLGASGLLALVMAVLLPLTSLAEKTKRLIAWSVLGATTLQFFGVLLAYFVNLAAIYIADLGAAILFIGVAWVLFGLFTRDDGALDVADYVQSRVGSASSLLLVKAGVLLLPISMLLGMYLAWLIVSGGEAQTLAAVAQSVEQVMQNDVTAAQSTISNFKFMQAKSAINAASHSHGLVLACFMILIALLRPMINLGEKFFRNCCIGLVVLAYALPLWIFLAINFWFNFRFFANYTGVLLAALTTVIIYGAIRKQPESGDTEAGGAT